MCLLGVVYSQMTFLPPRISDKVISSSLNESRIVVEFSESHVALIAKDGPHFTGDVTMVNVPLIECSHRSIGSTDGAFPFLRKKHLVKLVSRHLVFSEKTVAPTIFTGAISVIFAPLSFSFCVGSRMRFIPRLSLFLTPCALLITKVGVVYLLMGCAFGSVFRSSHLSNATVMFLSLFQRHPSASSCLALSFLRSTFFYVHAKIISFAITSASGRD